MITGVYQIKNLVNGKIYIGSAKKMSARKAGHICLLSKQEHHNPLLQEEWNIYGRDNFEFTKLLYCDRDMALFYEQCVIDKFKPEYNLCPSAYSSYGLKTSDKAKMNMSRAHEGVPLSVSHRKSLSEAYGHSILRQQALVKIHQDQIGAKRSEATKEKMRRAWVIRKSNARSKP